jgi:hypothetical protein
VIVLTRAARITRNARNQQITARETTTEPNSVSCFATRNGDMSRESTSLLWAYWWRAQPMEENRTAKRNGLTILA